jgi:hypothetical protein
MADQMDHVSEDLLPREAFEEKYKEHFAALAMKRVEEAVSLVGLLDRK